MARTKNKDREYRIEMEIVVDCHDSEERAMAWYSYLQDSFEESFAAHCIARRPISPLKVGDEVEVFEMAPASECERELFVMIRWEKDGLAVPLAQLKAAGDAIDATRKAVEDWLYWVKQGYEF